MAFFLTSTLTIFLKQKPSPNCSLCVVAFAGVFLLAVSSASAQYVFASDYNGGNVYAVTPGGAQSTFATGLNFPLGLAFDGSGNLFVANSANNQPGGDITKITHRAAFKAPLPLGFANPLSPTFNSAGDLFVGSGYGVGNGSITEITPGGTPSPFASGLSFPGGLAFNSAGDLFASSQSSGVISEFTPGGVQSTFTNLLTTAVNGLLLDNAGVDVYRRRSLSRVPL